MRYILIIILLISYNTLSQNRASEVEVLMDSLYNHLITKNGCSIDFEYRYENENYKMEKPITGNIVFFTEDRFFLEFNSKNQERIQIFDGEKFMTILSQEKEIQIENLESTDNVLIKDIFKNYKTKFNHYSKTVENQNTIIKLAALPHESFPIYLETGENLYYIIYNDCIDYLNLPSCLKLPKQCRIGVSLDNQRQLDECITKFGTIIAEDVVYIEIDNIQNQLKNIIIYDQSLDDGGKTSISIQNINEKKEDILEIDSLINIGFEIIDLR